MVTIHQDCTSYCTTYSGLGAAGHHHTCPHYVDLRPWGYAPGGYCFICIDCPPYRDPMSQWAAKRSWRCEKHALEARYNAQQGTTQIGESAPAAGAPKTTVDGSYEWPITPRKQA